jgi:uncharacterized protein YrrD
MADDPNRPVSWLLVEPGWSVLGADGSRIGTVEEVLGDEERDIFSGLAVATGMLGKPRFVPAERVTTIEPERVATDVHPNEVDLLEQREPGSGAG